MAESTLKDRIRKEMRRAGVVLGFLAVFLLLLIAFRGVIVPFLVAMFIAYLVEPLVVRMSKLKLGPVRLGRGGSLLALYAVLIGVIVIGAMVLVPRASSQVQSLAESAPDTFEMIRDDWVPEVDAWIESLTTKGDKEPEVGAEAEPPEVPASAKPPKPAGGSTPKPAPAAPVETRVHRSPEGEVTGTSETYEGRAPETPPPAPPTTVGSALDSLVEEAQKHFVDAVGLVTSVLKGIVGFVYSFVLILMITAFIVVDREKISAFFDGLAPDRYQAHYRRAIRIVDAGLSGVVRGQILVCVINGVLTWLGLVILGIPYSLLLAGVATVLSLIPIFGTILSSIPIVAIALTKGWGFGLAALGWICVIHLIEANIINPRVIGNAAKLHPVIIVFALLAGEHAFGVVGALLAVPAASILISTFRYARIITAEEEGEAAVAAAEPSSSG